MIEKNKNFLENKRLASRTKEYQSTDANSTSHRENAVADIHGEEHYHSDRLCDNILAPREAFGRIARYFNGSREARTTGIPSATLRSSGRK